MTHLAVVAIGSDRPGIVAAVTSVLMEHGCNLEDTSMSILRGHFAMMLVVAAPAGLAAGALERSLDDVAGRLELVVAVRAIADEVRASPPGETWTVAVYGADRPGIVHRVAKLLAERSVNIVDLTTRVIGDPDRPVYAMTLDVTLPAGDDGSDLQSALRELGDELGISCRAHAADADIF